MVWVSTYPYYLPKYYINHHHSRQEYTKKEQIQLLFREKMINSHVEAGANVVSCRQSRNFLFFSLFGFNLTVSIFIFLLYFKKSKIWIFSAVEIE